MGNPKIFMASKRIFSFLFYPNECFSLTVVLRFWLALEVPGGLSENIKAQALLIFSEPQPQW